MKCYNFVIFGVRENKKNTLTKRTGICSRIKPRYICLSIMRENVINCVNKHGAVTEKKDNNVYDGKGSECFANDA